MKFTVLTKRLEHLLLLVFIIIAFCVLSIDDYFNNYSSLIISLSFTAIIIFSSVLLVLSVKKYSYSFDVMFWIFGLIFFGVAPLVQYYMNWKAWGLKASNDEILKANFIVIIWFLSYVIGGFLGSKKKIIRWKTLLKPKPIIPVLNNNRLFLLSFFSIFIVALMLKIYGFLGLFLRGFTNTGSLFNASLSLVFYHFFRNALLFSFAITLYFRTKQRIDKKIILLLGFLFIIGCFPTSLSRYMMATYYLGLFVLILPEKRKNSVLFSILFFLGVTIVFPAANLFRNALSFEEFTIASLTENFKNMFLSGNYDAHSMIISATKFIESYNYTYGKQIVGAFFFFIPRSIWKGKPIGSGAYVIETLNQYDFTNVSMPLVGEAFMGFGLIGVVIIGMVVGFFARRIDNRYWNNRDKTSAFGLVYPFVVFYYFFMQRGDLMSSWAYTFSTIVVGYLVFVYATHGLKMNRDFK